MGNEETGTARSDQHPSWVMGDGICVYLLRGQNENSGRPGNDFRLPPSDFRLEFLLLGHRARLERPRVHARATYEEWLRDIACLYPLPVRVDRRRSAIHPSP